MDARPAFIKNTSSMTSVKFTLFYSLLVMSVWYSDISFGQTRKATTSPKALQPAKKATAAIVKGQKPPKKEAGDFVQKVEDGNINWTDQYIEAEGNSVIDTGRFKIPAQAKLMAQRGAIADAQRNLLEIVEGVLVEGQTTVENLMVQSDNLKTSVKGLLKGARQVGKTQYSEGMATVYLRIPLYQKGLGEVVAEETHKDTSAPDSAATPLPDSARGGLVLAVKGEYKPRLLPNLTDEQGNVLGNLAEGMDPTGGKATKVVKQGKQAYEAAKKGDVTQVIDVVQDAAGNLVVSDKNKATLDKWLRWGKTIWSVIKAIII